MFDGDGVSFTLTSEHATAVHVCLFDAATDRVEARAIPLTRQADGVWRAHVPGLRAGQLYGYRVFGPWDPAQGHRFNPAKIVFDPYARLVGRAPRIDDTVLGHAPGTDGDGAADATDDAASAPLAAVHDGAFDWSGDAPPRTAWSRTVIYEVHVKGFTARHPDVPERDRGTFAGLASPAAIAHLKRLGVTAVELLPIHAHADEPALVRRGLTNYWGYNTLGWFAPDPRFVAPGAQLDAVSEFKRMVRALHAAGLEVILDVVYNHTAEGDHVGPTLSWRGIDNAASYRLQPSRRARYRDWTGCGNTVDVRPPAMRQLVVDSLRYWVDEMHVDGFRFDLTSALIRGDDGEVDWQSAWLRAIESDPVLSRVKLIAEPWDAAPGGYQLGGFSPAWSEWNDRYRDDVRRFWRGDAGIVDDLTTRLAGSRDLFGRDGRTPRASINFVTAHDGFTLADLVAYNERHYEANGENNQDGMKDNASWNCGVEGATDDPAIVALRARQRRNFLLTLAVSQGVPMLSGGDEMGRTQLGNNNAYCHDSPLTWTPWELTDDARELVEFVGRIFALRAAHPVLRRETFLEGRNGGGVDVVWLRADGREMNADDWTDRERRTIGMLLNGDLATGGPGGETLLIAMNASPEAHAFTPPPDRAWEIVLDTTDPSLPVVPVPDGLSFPMAEHSAVVLRQNALQSPRFISPQEASL
jgi:glycogen operon protein